MVKEYLRELINKWKVYRLLKQSGCKTIEQYNKMHDHLINHRTDTVSAFYHGYQYVVRIPYSLYTGDWHESIEQLSRWCEKNCKETWRHDWHRVEVSWLKDGTILKVHDNFSYLTGSDFVYFAFICQKDYNWFVLSHDLND